MNASIALVLAATLASGCHDWRHTVTFRDATTTWTEERGGTCAAVIYRRPGVVTVRCEDRKVLSVPGTIAAGVLAVAVVGLIVGCFVVASARY